MISAAGSAGHAKAAPPLAAELWRKPGFLDFSGNTDFGNFPVGFGVWGHLQTIGNGFGLQIDGFSALIQPYESSFEDFHDFVQFSVV